MRKRVVITGAGCATPLGLDVQTTWDNVVAGKSGIGPITLFDSSEYKVHFAGEVKGFDGAEIFGKRAAHKMDRFAQFAVFASQQAVEDAQLKITDQNRKRIGVVIGSGIGGLTTAYQQAKVLVERGPRKVSPFLVPMMLPDTAPGMVAIYLGVRGPNFAVISACATGSNAIGEGAEIIRRGHADVVLAGGAEAVINPLAMAGLGVMNALSKQNDAPQQASRPFDLHRNGFVMGEGAGVLVLESLEHAQQRGANILAEVSGYGSTNDAYHISAPSVNGEGAAECIQMALDDAGFSTDQIDYINAHGTSTKLNDKGETEAIKTVFGSQAYNIPVSSTKSMTGHLLGASGALEGIFCMKVLQTGIIPPTINYQTPDPECDLDYVPNQARRADVRATMSNSFGFGGHNATVIFSRWNGQSK